MRDGGGEQEDGDEQMEEEEDAADEPVAPAAAPTEPVAVQAATGIVSMMPYFVVVRRHSMAFSCFHVR